MGRIIVSDNISIDGVVQDPAGDEGFDRGGWVGAIKDRPDLARLALDEAMGADAFLMGRRTYDWFASRWPLRTGELAERLNGMPKYVVTATREQLAWPNATVLHGDPIDAVADLKRRLGGEIVVPGSFGLVGVLLECGLVDELRLKVFPVVLGAGDRLFGETSSVKAMRLVDVRTLDGDTAYLTFKKAEG